MKRSEDSLIRRLYNIKNKLDANNLTDENDELCISILVAFLEENKEKEKANDFGCPPEIIVRAMDRNIWYEWDGKLYREDRILWLDLENKEISSIRPDTLEPKLSFPFSEYKKSWWTREDKSE